MVLYTLRGKNATDIETLPLTPGRRLAFGPRLVYNIPKTGREETAVERVEQLGSYTYRWDKDCFPLGADSLALGEFATVRPRNAVLDLGCGAGLLLLLCARREPGVTLHGAELSPHAAGLARQNLAENGLTGEILTGDLRALPLPGGMDLVLSNPPWYPGGQAGDAARVEGCSLPELCAAASRCLKPKGRFALVHRPERMVQLLAALTGAGLEPKRLQFCRGRADRAPYALLVEAVKGGNPGIEILPERLG